ncbi:MAG: hypothetical protein JXR46_00075 [Calditrichaceae bacterium]|nr:hypothetical protein [Calditrichaceae bacterium]MBN2707408.1 hypothetical protein [Calditrichaceae bacterium]RQV96958.1 MAG: hypothetical protein EH224_02935 [Calditrichota bacterium]
MATRPYYLFFVMSGCIIFLFTYCSKVTDSLEVNAGNRIIDHTKASFDVLDAGEVELARQKLHIAYGHTSHGRQITNGMTGLVDFKGDLFAWNNGGVNGALDLRDTPFSGASDLGNPNFTAWEKATRNYLAQTSDINVVIWSWCGEVNEATTDSIDTYLSLMTGLENDFPGVKFVYMTGHLEGTGEEGNLNQRNEQIRSYCRQNNKILYDFADIESYDPDGHVNYMKLYGNDGCYYDTNGDKHPDINPQSNWAIVWQESHEPGVDWYNYSVPHSQPLNGNRKAYAAWYLWCQLAKIVDDK